MVHMAANIIWQSNGWTGLPEVIEGKGFSWVDKDLAKKRPNIAGEAVNFKLDHPQNCGGRVYGYFATPTGRPRQYMESSQGKGLVFFCSTHPREGRKLVAMAAKSRWICQLGVRRDA